MRRTRAGFAADERNVQVSDVVPSRAREATQHNCLNMGILSDSGDRIVKIDLSYELNVMKDKGRLAEPSRPVGQWRRRLGARYLLLRLS
jgi:hypothetical protein